MFHVEHLTEQGENLKEQREVVVPLSSYSVYHRLLTLQGFFLDYFKYFKGSQVACQDKSRGTAYTIALR